MNGSGAPSTKRSSIPSSRAAWGSLLDRYFKSETIKSCMVYSPDPRGLWVVGNALPSAYYACNRYVDPADTGLPKGGMGGLTRAMAASARSSGVSIRTSAKVKKVIIRDGKAIGVELEDGEQLESAYCRIQRRPVPNFPPPGRPRESGFRLLRCFV